MKSLWLEGENFDVSPLIDTKLVEVNVKQIMKVPYNSVAFYAIRQVFHSDQPHGNS